MVARKHIVDERDPGAGPAPRSARWVVPHALAMGLCQTVMLAALLLGPAGLGFGGAAWGSPGFAAAFFAALSVAMTINELLSRRGVGRGGDAGIRDGVRTAFKRPLSVSA